MTRPKLIVFDMDGVLIDVSGSYRETARKTARLFFNEAKGFGKLPDPLFPLTDLAELKQTGGLNNDWDLTAMTLQLLFALVKPPDVPLSGEPPPSAEETIRRCDVSDLADFLNASSRPLMELLDRYGRRHDPFVTSCYQGDVVTGNRIKRIFQEIYLGRSLFTALYGDTLPQGVPVPGCYRGEGLIHRESLLMDPTLLADLSRDHILAVATGRPRAEADFPLDRFDLRKYFQLVITLDDCTREEERIYTECGERISLKKPDPYMLDLIPHRIGKGFSEFYYLGDMPDDMQAARSSKTGYRGIGVVLSSADPENLRKELLQAGAEQIIDDYAELPVIFG
ncbi:MAG: HAD family hydrolase [Proteobacteria bacterium]|nr:HAD family hydrolase [Pseudomonadota bacterium]MBU4581236.1 HAD family hydrolase [Pseudomonadota bacterium]MCG2741499.1 HAD family hydrolase [Syntrophaceae bacterium]